MTSSPSGQNTLEATPSTSDLTISAPTSRNGSRLPTCSRPRFSQGGRPRWLRRYVSEPKGQQRGLKPIDIAGQTINPATDDFYQRLIIHRNAIKAKLETASAADKPALKSDEQAIKILANATSYGIFVELNVSEYVKTERMVGYGGRPQPIPLQVPDIGETRRILSPAACNADHWRGEIDVGVGRASSRRAGAGLGLL